MSKEYYITEKDNEYAQVLSTIECLIDKSKREGNYPVWGEILERLQTQLNENGGENVTPWQYNMIISILLDFVPEDVKDLKWISK